MIFDSPTRVTAAWSMLTDRPDADVEYTFIQILASESATLTYTMNCGNISAGVAVFALAKTMVPNVKDGTNTLPAWKDQTPEAITKSTLPFAVPVAPPADYTTMLGTDEKATDIDPVARLYAGIGALLVLWG